MPQRHTNHCARIFDFAKKFGGVVTVLWHYENLTPPRDWSGHYADLVKRAQADGAWVTTAGDVVEWFGIRREIRINSKTDTGMLTITAEGILPTGILPQLMVRIHLPDNRQITVNTESLPGKRLY